MNTKNFFALLVIMGALLFTNGPTHHAAAAVQGVDIDEFTFSSPAADHVSVYTINPDDSITLFWKTTTASRCESYAKGLRQGVWSDKTAPGWSTQTREFQNPVDGLRVTPKESTRLYLKCYNDTDQTSVEKWIEVRIGATTQTRAGGTIAGLRGMYYDTAGDPITRDEKGGDIVMIRIDPRVSFSWKNQKPTSLISSPQFTTEWKGDLTPGKTGNYSFALLTDQGGALWINDELVIEGAALTTQEFSSTRNVFMEVGRTYHIRLKTRHAASTAVTQLSWITPDGKKEIIPARYLTTDALPTAIAQGKGNGVRATYSQYLHFDTPATQTIVRTDPSPVLTIPAPFQQKGDLRFDTTWEGSLVPRVTDFYRFYTEADGLVEFTLKGNDQDVSLTTSAEQFEKHQTTSLFLEAGKSYSLRLAYHQSKGVANARLLWSRAGKPIKELIPRAQLFSSAVKQNNPTKKGTGLAGTYYNGENFDQKSFTRVDKTINFNWKYGSPKKGPILPDHFSVRWEGSIEAPTTDFYQFSSRIDDRVALWINGQKIFDTSKFRAGQTLYSLPILLKAGERYPIKIEYADYISMAYIDLQWANSSGKRSIVPMQYLYPAALKPKAPGIGLRGDYYEGANFEKFVTRHAAEYLGFDWGNGPPDPTVPSDYFSVRWTGWIEPRFSDRYTFTTKVDDGVRLWISDKDQNSIPSGTLPLIDKWDPIYGEYSAEKTLEAGHRYFIRVEHHDSFGPAQAKLFWASAHQQKEVVPRRNLYPEPFLVDERPEGAPIINGDGDGLYAEYFGDDHLGRSILHRIDDTINFDWGNGPPDPAVPSDYFSVRWTGWIEPRFSDRYTFTTKVDDGVRLWISDKDQNSIPSGTLPLIDKWDPIYGEYSAEKTLEAGHRYFIRVEHHDSFGPAQAKLFWASAHQQKEVVPRSQLHAAPEFIMGPPPGNGTGLRGRYYRGGNTAYDNALPYPAVERIDSLVDFAWRYGVPYYSLPATNFSVRWEGYIQPQFDGDYTFSLQADDSARLWVEESNIYDSMPPLINRGADVFKEYSAIKTLKKGHLYHVRVDYSQGAGDAYVHLWWSHAQLRKQIVPQSQLYPPGTTILSPR